MWRCIFETVKTAGRSNGPLFLISVSCTSENIPADELYKENSGEYTSTVNAYVSFGRFPSGYERLMKLVRAGKAYTDESGKEKKENSTKTVYIKRKRDTNGKNEIFCHMCGLSYRRMDPVRVVGNSFCTQIFIQNLICSYYDFVADIITERAGCFSGLTGKRENQIHHT